MLWQPSSIALPERSRSFPNLLSLPSRQVGIVFGALVRPDGAVALYRAGTVKKLLMTGDNGRNSYDEVSAMRRQVEASGVSGEDITLDYAGFSTYDSCYRAQPIFGLGQAILVTQDYHMPRALYTCRKLGIDALGYALPNFERYPDLRIPYSLREYAADLKAWIMLNVTHPKPRLLGEEQHILGPG